MSDTSKSQKATPLRWLMRAVLVGIALFSISLFFKENDAAEKSTQTSLSQSGRMSDYVMSDFTITTMDEMGKPSRILSGSHMAHYPDDDSIEVTSQISHIVDEEGETWLILSDKGVTHQGSDQVQLTGNVIITRPGNKEIELYTDSLHIDLATNTADSDQPVRIVSPTGETHGTGLDANLNTSVVKLHSKVRGNYEPFID